MPPLPGYGARNSQITEELAPCLLGVPLAPDLTDATIGQVVDALRLGVGDRR